MRKIYQVILQINLFMHNLFPWKFGVQVRFIQLMGLAGLENVESVNWTRASSSVTKKGGPLNPAVGSNASQKACVAQDVQPESVIEASEQAENSSSKAVDVERGCDQGDHDIRSSETEANGVGECSFKSPSGPAGRVEYETSEKENQAPDKSSCLACAAKDKALEKAAISLITIAVELSHALTRDSTQESTKLIEDISALLKIVASPSSDSTALEMKLDSKSAKYTRSTEDIDCEARPASWCNDSEEVAKNHKSDVRAIAEQHDTTDKRTISQSNH